MARQPRFFVPGLPLHVIQRGNNRGDIFVSSGDYQFFLDCLRDACHEFDVAVHAYVLMTNHVHLLVTPARADGLPRALQSVGRRYVQYFNRVHDRTGTLWEGRYRATIVDTDRYFFACMRYIELNPVRAGITDRPGGYPWSSYPANARGAVDRLVTYHELYEELGRSNVARRSAYQRLYQRQLPDADVDAIREATNKNWALGDARFARWIESATGRRSLPARRHLLSGRAAPSAPSGSDSMLQDRV